jgi:hypothetical protein
MAATLLGSIAVFALFLYASHVTFTRLEPGVAVDA